MWNESCVSYYSLTLRYLVDQGEVNSELVAIIFPYLSYYYQFDLGVTDS